MKFIEYMINIWARTGLRIVMDERHAVSSRAASANIMDTLKDHNLCSRRGGVIGNTLALFVHRSAASCKLLKYLSSTVLSSHSHYSRYDVCRCFSQGPDHTGEMEELANGNLAKNKTLPVAQNKEEVSPLKAAEKNLYRPNDQNINGV